MENNRFTYVIRSSSKEVKPTADTTNNCTMRLSGLPTHYKFYDCTVAALHVSTQNTLFTTSTFELKCDGMDIVNGRDSKGGSLYSVAFASFNNTYPQGSYTFRCSNFNGRTLRFQLYDDSNNLLTSNYNNAGVLAYDRPWILILNIEGIK